MTGNYRSLWDLNRKGCFNHGSFGATPSVVLEAQARIMASFNADREEFIWNSGFEMQQRAIARVADFINADATDVVFTDNATDSYNAVLKSLPLGPGDEVLITTHAYSNYPPLLEEESRRRGFKVVVADVPYPPENAQKIVDAVLAKAGDATRLAVIDHITSPTAVIFPVKEIVAALAARGIDTFVDGAHAPGQIPSDMRDIGAAYYTGNHHKWLCAPVSSAFLYVQRDRQDLIMPAVGSGMANRDCAFVDRFSWTGTKDPSARLAVPEAIDYMASLHPDGWPGIMVRNHALAVQARELICERLGMDAPYDEALFGAMFTIPLGNLKFDAETEKKIPFDRIYSLMQARHGFGVYSNFFQGQYLLRVSCPLYNDLSNYEVLADGIASIVAEFKV